jgi:hypothetical protein
MRDLDIMHTALEMIADDAKTYGLAEANVKARVEMHTLVNELLRTHSTSIEMSLVARDLADLVVAAVTGANKERVVARAIADLAKICPQLARKQPEIRDASLTA